MIDNQTIIDASHTTKTPFYIYDIRLLHDTLRALTTESSRYGFVVHYALKANFDETLLSIIKEYGLGIDCVSGNEVRHAIECGFSPKTIVYAGVGKTDEEIEYSIDSEIMCFNCESAQEIYVINDIAQSKGRVANIAIRVNPDIDPKTHKYISTGQKESKFGMSYIEIDEVLSNIDTLKNVKINGIHFHIGSQITDLGVFTLLSQKVNKIVDWFESKNIDFDIINVGGGLGINYNNPWSEPIANFREYFEIFNRGVKLKSHQKLHFELGRSVVGQCGILITKVLFNKITSTGHNFAIVDAGMTDLLRPALYQAKHEITLISESNNENGDTLNYSIGGPVCESSDVFRYNINLPRFGRGDLLAIHSVGAYGTSMTSKYNLRDLPSTYYTHK